MNDKNKYLALTIDLEDWYHLPSITGAPGSKFGDVPNFFCNWTSRYDFLSDPTVKVLNLFQELDVKATFFAVADIVEHYPGLIEKIAKKGHEIACHGLHHACKIDPKTKKPLISRSEFRERTLKAKSILEQACGQEVVGYRAPNAYVAGWMIDILEEIGFQYDSSVSVNSVYNKTDSRLKNVDTRAYYPEREKLEPGKEKRRIVEIPWPYFRFLAKFPAGGGPILRFFGARYIMRGLCESLTRGDTLFYFHPIDISNEDMPLNSSLSQRLFWLIKGESIFGRVKTILTDTRFNIITCRDMVLKNGT